MSVTASLVSWCDLSSQQPSLVSHLRLYFEPRVFPFARSLPTFTPQVFRSTQVSGFLALTNLLLFASLLLVSTQQVVLVPTYLYSLNVLCFPRIELKFFLSFLTRPRLLTCVSSVRSTTSSILLITPSLPCGPFLSLVFASPYLFLPSR